MFIHIFYNLHITANSLKFINLKFKLRIPVNTPFKHSVSLVIKILYILIKVIITLSLYISKCIVNPLPPPTPLPSPVPSFAHTEYKYTECNYMLLYQLINNVFR